MDGLAPESGMHKVNSMLAQLYAHGGRLLRHRNEDLSCWIGLSLGYAAQFVCLPEEGSWRESLCDEETYSVNLARCPTR